MNTVHHIDALRDQLKQARQLQQRIALVPTMGNLHAGHISLIKRAREVADVVVASVFVNPLQFGPNEDYDSYPRTLEEDQRKLTEAGCDFLFAPSVKEMYPHGQHGVSKVQVFGVSEGLCGGARPGHFDGVATVVTKLFNIVQPDIAIFGQKDYQQLAVIRAFVNDLNIPVEILSGDIVRDHDGLALSSRNAYLSADERAKAPALYQVLSNAKAALQLGNEPANVLSQAVAALIAAGFRLDYLELRDALTLQPAQADTRDAVLLAAAFMGTTRLLDNTTLTLPH